MRGRLWIVCCVGAMAGAACTIDYPDDTFACAASSPRCPAGMVCGADDVCRRTAAHDAGADRDAGDAGVEVDAANVDAGCAQTIEACAPGDRVDDDCDGRVDEGCGLSFSTVHVPLEIYRTYSEGARPLRSNNEYRAPWLSPDGEHLYFLHVIGARQTLYRAERLDPREPFDTMAEVGAFGLYQPIWFALSDDELSLVYEAQNPIRAGSLMMASREDRDEAFVDHRVALPEDAGTAVQPTLSSDGLEVIYVREGASVGLVSARRATTEAMFEGPINFAAPMATPRLSEDGLTLYAGAAGAIRAFERPSTNDDFGGPGEPVAAFDAASLATAYAPMIRRSRGVMYFNVDDDDRSPAGVGILRARACAIPMGASGMCPEMGFRCGNDEIGSWDPARCYFAPDTLASREELVSLCEDRGGTLAALHAPMDYADVQQALEPTGFPRLLGLRRSGEGTPYVHDNGAPFTYAPWADGQPEAGRDCSALARPPAPPGQSESVPCTTGRALCQEVRWPRW